MHENIEKINFIKIVLVSIYTYRNEHYLYKIDFFDVFIHFELRYYADGASNLLIEVWDSSASGPNLTKTEEQY